MILELSHVTKKIKGVTVLDDISLSLSSGHIYGIKGKNGSGKNIYFHHAPDAEHARGISQ